MELKKKCWDDNRSSNSITEIYFSWGCSNILLINLEQRLYHLCTRFVQMVCADTEKWKKEVTYLIIRIFKRCIYRQKLCPFLSEAVWPMNSQSSFSVFSMTKSVWAVFLSKYRHHHSNEMFLSGLEQKTSNCREKYYNLSPFSQGFTLWPPTGTLSKDFRRGH